MAKCSNDGVCIKTSDKNPPYPNVPACMFSGTCHPKHIYPDVRWKCDKNSYQCLGTSFIDKNYPYTIQAECTTDCVKPPPPPPPSKGLSPGIIVIIILVPLILIGIAVGVFVWKRKHKSTLTSTLATSVPAESSAEEIPTLDTSATPVPAESSVEEIPTSSSSS